MRFISSGSEAPTLTLYNTAASQILLFQSRIMDPTSGSTAPLRIVSTAKDGVISFYGNNTGYTGGFHVDSPHTLTLTFVYASSLGNNTVRLSNVRHNVRLGSGTTTSTYNGNFIIDEGATAVFQAGAQSGGRAIIQGTISGDGDAQFWAYNGGALELTGSNTYTGNTVVAAKLDLTFHGVENFGNGNKISFTTSGNSSPTLIWAEGNTDDLTKKPDGTQREVDFLGSNTTLDVGSNNVTLANSIASHNNAGTGMTKKGSGTLRLLSANTYGLLTTVAEGTLLVNNSSNSGTGVSEVIVHAALGGIGRMSPTGDRSIIFEENAIFTPGDSEIANGVGTITVDLANTTGTLRFKNLSRLYIDLGDGNTADQISLTSNRSGSVLFEGTTIITLFNKSELQLEDGDYILFSASTNDVYSGLTTEDGEIVGGLALGDPLPGYLSSLHLENGNIILKLQAIPEPSSLMLIGVSAVFLIYRRHRIALN